MKAKAAVFMGANVPFEVREFEITDTPAGYGRSELIASGICGTDVHFHNGKLSVAAPTIIGHEFVGRLVDLNEEEGKRYGLKKGDRVIADIAVPCGECLLCKSGDDANCVRMRVTNGGSIETPPYLFGGYTRVNYTPLSNLIRIPERLDAEMVCIFACPGPTAMHAFALAGRAGVDLADIRTAVVQGLGPVGTYAVMYLKAMGVKQVFAITAGTNARREELAKSLGASEVFNLSRTGAAVPQGMELLRNRGVYLVPGQYSNSGSVAIAPQLITFKALHIIGSSQYSVSDVRDYLSFLLAHPELHAKIRELGNRYPLEEVNKAFLDAKSGNNIKTLLV